MADYVSLQEAIDSGTDNMTILRSNSRNDDNTTTYATDIDWFYFNSAQVTNLYSSGNSWIGFGISLEQLRVNRRDCAVYYEYMETGVIGITKFLKFRWCGTSYYSPSYASNPDYQQRFDVWLFDNGQIFLDFFQVPVTTGSGSNNLICGNESVSFTVTAGTACEYTFTPSNPATGTGWSVEAGRPDLTVNHKTSGTADFETTAIQDLSEIVDSQIIWDSIVPTGTSLRVYAKLTGGAWVECTNGEALPVFSPSIDLSNETLYIQVRLSTTDQILTPVLASLYVSLIDIEDTKVIVINFAPGNQTSVQNAGQPITVAYNGVSLMGDGGPVQAFELECPIVGLEYKGNQNDSEHLEITGITATGTLTQIHYSSYQSSGEHLEITGITATGTLTHIDDI